jgi:hypothetical protein
MRRLFFVLAAALVLAACATSKSTQPKVKIPDPGIGIEQVVGPRELGYPYGPIEVKYNFAVQNNASIPMTLTRIDIQSEGVAGGAYTLRRYSYPFHQEIPPNSVGVVTFWARAMGWGQSMRETEPVTVRGVAHFQTTAGATQKVFVRDLSQYAN